MSSRLLTVILLACSCGARAEFSVFACEPEWADLARALVPDARVTVATSAWQDPHYIEPRPSLIAAMRNSDLAVCTGASLETGWLPVLIQRAANHNIAENRQGLFYAASHTHLHQPHDHIDRSMGDVHPEGNPHFHLNPHAAPEIMERLAHRIEQVAPAEDTKFMRALHTRWKMRWKQSQEQWRALAVGLKGMKVVVQHSGFDYLLRYAGIEAVLDLEPKPGLPPTPSHLNQLLNDPRLQEASVILISPYQDPQPAQWLAERTGLKVLILPTTLTEDEATDTLPELITHILTSLSRFSPKSTRVSVSDER
ncbi:ABC-type metal ion transport system, periplasmic component/surface adhesin [Hahella chejuensis KCTC 2396]|uniref:ABC-type metal ion transport system, periplasmic component/surface adhesin n=1 Tax=Hahella chejuensis (strain KCTC 2396) TaxID=349521 RepID=Q2SI07_HAHCH|nr:zinc ABC transporter substrate-binding protein [Hahella chejuensis]ABC29717.1 ABC-type metal ion transport system, periplasmic component/surface adhesin [Hahella chejuensis KCTC 2396]